MLLFRGYRHSAHASTVSSSIFNEFLTIGPVVYIRMSSFQFISLYTTNNQTVFTSPSQVFLRSVRYVITRGVVLQFNFNYNLLTMTLQLAQLPKRAFPTFMSGIRPERLLKSLSFHRTRFHAGQFSGAGGADDRHASVGLWPGETIDRNQLKLNLG